MGDLMDLADLEQGIMKRSEHERLMKQQEDKWKRQLVLEIERLKKRARQVLQEQKEYLNSKWKIEWEKREKYILDIQAKNIDRHEMNTAKMRRAVDEIRRLRDENRRLKEMLQRQNAASSLMGMRSPKKRKRNLKNLQNLPYH